MNPEQDNGRQKALLKQSLPVRTQFLIFTLFGDYVLGKSDRIWTGTLLRLMESLGVSHQAVRSALSRMTRKGWIRSERHGRLSQHILTAQGEQLLALSQSRFFEQTTTDWDGQWHLVIYSLPEKNRDLRHDLRTQLAWLGFGQLATGIWISPHDRSPALQAIIADLKLQRFVDLFSGGYLGPAQASDLIRRSWNLELLAGQYRAFIQRFQPQHQALLRQIENSTPPAPEEAFVQRFWLTHSFQSFPLRDPNLPLELLPRDWVGTAARQLFEDHHRLLGRYATPFVDDLLAQPAE